MSRPVGGLLLALLYCILVLPRCIAANELSHKSQSKVAPQRQLAIIGGGIGGAACAYYVNTFASRDHTKTNYNITIFEKEGRLGGRLKHAMIDGVAVNMGGDAWSNVNEYMMQLQRELPIPLDNSSYDGNGKLGLYAGQGRWIDVPYWDLLNDAVLMLAVDEARALLWANYLQRGQRAAFRSIPQFLSYGDLNMLTSVSSSSYFNSWLVTDKFLNNSVLPLLRTIYDQDLSASGFAGVVSVLSAITDSYSTLGGNDNLVDLLAQRSAASISLRSEVASLAFDSNTHKYIVGTNGQEESKHGTIVKQQNYPIEFDAVVLAAPIEFIGIEFHNIKLPNITMRQYRHWYVIMVEAKGLNNKYFGYPSNEEVPDNILTTGDSTAPFVAIGVQGITAKGLKIYKIFSNYNLSDTTLSAIFVNKQRVLIQYWPYTFPELHPFSNQEQASSTSPASVYQPQPVILADELYYLNTMESVASAMEGSVIAARNAALMLKSKEQC